MGNGELSLLPEPSHRALISPPPPTQRGRTIKPLMLWMRRVRADFGGRGLPPSPLPQHSERPPFLWADITVHPDPLSRGELWELVYRPLIRVARKPLVPSHSTPIHLSHPLPAEIRQARFPL